MPHAFGPCSRIARSLLGAPIFFCAAGASAQQQFAELPKLHLPRDGSQPAGIAPGDFDRDGDIDLAAVALGPSGPETRLYFNTDRGVFGAGVPLVSPGGMPFALDVDGDFDLDLLVEGGPATLLLNDGSGIFSFGPGVPYGDASLFAAGDVDGDLDLDVVVGDHAPLSVVRSTKLWLNDGLGNF